ncbi:MAG: AtpZ/AtpI family protein [Flavobacteriales bacterium]|nr:AtpZ/AtpI family protein [Flavobacteriales bacterium]
MGFQLAATIFIGAYFGDYLDDNYPISERRIYTLILTLLATGGATYNAIRQLNQSEE